MFLNFMKRFSSVLYVQIWEERLKVTDVANDESFDDSPIVVIQTQEKGKKVISGIGKRAANSVKQNEIAVNPFSHPRALLSNFYVGEKLLQHAFKSLGSIKSFRPRPKVVMHPMEKTEGGLTAIEERAFRELALGAGAIDIKIHVGKPLNTYGFQFDEFQEENKEGMYNEDTKQSSSYIATFLIYFIIVIFAVWHLGG